MKGLRYILSIMLTGLVTCLYADTFRVTASQLNVRQQASTDATVLYKLQQNELVEGISVGDWIQVERDGIVGFASSKYLEPFLTEEPVEHADPKKFSLPIAKYIKWLILLSVVIIVLRVILKKHSLKSIIGIVVLIVLIIFIVPAIGKFLLGIIGLPKVGYYIGLGVAIIFCLSILNSFIFDSDDKNSTQNDTDYSEQPDYIYSDDQDYVISQNNYIDYPDDEDYFDEDYHNNDNEERIRKLEEELEEEKRQIKEGMYEDNNNKAEEWEYKYRDYTDRAKEAKKNADTQSYYAKDYYDKCNATDDELYKNLYYNKAKDLEENAEKYSEVYEKYQELANEAYRKYQHYKDEASRYSR